MAVLPFNPASVLSAPGLNSSITNLETALPSMTAMLPDISHLGEDAAAAVSSAIPLNLSEMQNLGSNLPSIGGFSMSNITSGLPALPTGGLSNLTNLADKIEMPSMSLLQQSNLGNMANLGIKMPTGEIPSLPDMNPLQSEDSAEGEEAATPEETSSGQERNYGGIPNPLLNFPSYTYGVSLHVLDPTMYNSIVEDGKYSPSGNVLIASAGRYGSQRATYFADTDFYIDNLKMTTVIGASQRSQNSNVIEINFTIIEPNGVTLMTRIIKTALERDANYLELPYLLQIEFFAYDDAGLPMSSDLMSKLTKYIPVKLIAMKMKVGTKGAEYQIQAIPFNHSAFTDTVVSVPININVTGEKVGDFFSAEVGGGTSMEGQISSMRDASKAITDEAARSKDTTATEKAAASAKYYENAVYQNQSIASAINAYFKVVQKENNYDEPDVIKFVMHPMEEGGKDEIGESKITNQKQANITNAPYLTNLSSDDAKGADNTNMGVQINAGTSVIQVINNILLTSYIRNQVADVTETTDVEKIKSYIQTKIKKGGEVKWFRIVPQVKLLGYDTKRRNFAREFTYHIVPYTMHNNVMPVVQKTLPSTVQKRYEYIYTGKNDSIIDFQLDFDAMYYVASSVLKDAISSMATAVKKPDPNTIVESNQVEEGVSDAQAQEVTKKPEGSDSVKQIPVGTQKEQQSVTGITDKKTAAAIDLRRSIMSNAKGDMISCNLKIIGDPHFIKQDDFFFNPAGKPTLNTTNPAGAPMTENFSLAMDLGEIFAYVAFKSPSDLDMETGLMSNEAQFYNNSMFDGIYRVITVDSMFTNGKFEQTLNLVRMMDQEEPLLNSMRAEETASAQAAGGLSSLTGGRSLVPDMPLNVKSLAQKANVSGALAGALPVDIMSAAGDAKSVLPKMTSGAGVELDGDFAAMIAQNEKLRADTRAASERLDTATASSQLQANADYMNKVMNS